MHYTVRAILYLLDGGQLSLGQCTFEAEDCEHANDMLWDLFAWRIPAELQDVRKHRGIGFNWLPHNWSPERIQVLVPDEIIQHVNMHDETCAAEVRLQNSRNTS